MFDAARRPRADLLRALAIMAWIGAVLLLDAVELDPAARLSGFEDWTAAETARQFALGVATWAVLAICLKPESPLVRVQTLIVVLLATMVEYTFSPVLEAYVYRIGTVPFFVPPGHGLVYLAAFLLGRALLTASPGPEVAARRERAAMIAVLAVGGAWAMAGLVADRPDHLGAFWFACLAGFLVWGPSRALYAGAFVVVSYLELAGTALGTWAWAPSDPVLGVVGQGNPPSGAAGGYGWFDLYALMLAPLVLALVRRVRRVRRGSRGRVSGSLVLQRHFVILVSCRSRTQGSHR